MSLTPDPDIDKRGSDEIVTRPGKYLLRAPGKPSWRWHRDRWILENGGGQRGRPNATVLSRSCCLFRARSAVGRRMRQPRPLASAKVSHAERAVEEAQQVGAATSAPVELRTAQDKLTAAQAAMAKGN